tara:strand:- start:4638 stop:5153 length:516 start_codon:yes stop_codon:yes gene_type:complete
MILTGPEIQTRLGKDIIIKPFNIEQLQPNSYDVTLNNKLLIYTDAILDLKKPPNYRELIIPEEGLILLPNTLYLGHINEYTETYGLVPMMHGKSSLGRMGIVPHVCAGLGDTGFRGRWTVEITCVHPVKIYPNIPIAQLTYHTVLGEYMDYNGKYQDSEEVMPSRYHENFK